MIQSIQGTIRSIEGSLVTIEVHGIGFAIQVAHPALYAPQSSAQIYTYLHWHQETGPQLFGFTSHYERQVFATFISCPGIGPKMGLNILQQTSAQTLVSAIALKEINTLSSLKGIGTKKAETIVSQLHDKMEPLIQAGSHGPEPSQALTHLHQLTQALQALNYSRPEINSTLEHLKSNYPVANYTFDAILRHALAFLAKTHV